MAVKFLSDEWLDALTGAANADEAFSNAIAEVDFSLQFQVTDVPDGEDIAYHMVIDDGVVGLHPGEMENADATVTNSYETAAAISQGELNTQMAFMTGKLKVAGNMAKVMMNQGALNQFGKAVGDVEVDY